MTVEHGILRAVGNGFILTAILWGSMLANLIDGKPRKSAVYALLCAACTLFGFIHSVAPSGEIYLPWRIGNQITWQIAFGYCLVGVFLFAASFHSGVP